MTALDWLLIAAALVLVPLGLCATAPFDDELDHEEVDPHALEGLVRVGGTNPTTSMEELA